MFVFEWTILVLLAAIVLSAIARRLGVPYPAFLALGGATVAMLPGTPHVALDPHLALALFVAPVLLDAAYDTSLRDLKTNWRAVGALVVVAVIITTLMVALVARLFVPAMPWAAAIALGAIVAPPDAAAATAIFRQVRLPHRMLVILEGESLLNDASALLIYRVAVAAVAAGSFNAVHLAPTFIYVIAGSILAGWVLARVALRTLSRVREVPTSIVLQFISTFGVWIVAEHLKLSGILTVVVYGVTIARTAPMLTPARLRVPSYAVWETVVFVLNVIAFMLIGLQLGPIWARLSPLQRWMDIGIAIAILFTVIGARFGSVMGYGAIARKSAKESRQDFKPTTIGGLVVSWSGMRGIVTLAAALALPDGSDGPAFPFRDLIILCSFGVVVGTLVIQGFTLGPVLAWAKLEDDGTVEKEVNEARIKAIRAGLAALQDNDSPQADRIREEYEDALRYAADCDGKLPDRLSGDRLRRKAAAAAREMLMELRDKGEIGDAAFHQVEERLDWLEMSAGGQSEP